MKSLQEEHSQAGRNRSKDRWTEICL